MKELLLLMEKYMNFSKESWVNHFAYLEQTAPIINGTLSENINISITNKPKEITELLNIVGLSYWLNGKILMSILLLIKICLAVKNKTFLCSCINERCKNYFV